MVSIYVYTGTQYAIVYLLLEGVACGLVVCCGKKITEHRGVTSLYQTPESDNGAINFLKQNFCR